MGLSIFYPRSSILENGVGHAPSKSCLASRRCRLHRPWPGCRLFRPRARQGARQELRAGPPPGGCAPRGRSQVRQQDRRRAQTAARRGHDQRRPGTARPAFLVTSTSRNTSSSTSRARASSAASASRSATTAAAACSCNVITPMVGTPAYEAGILAGDLIVKIDGKSTENMRLNEAVDLIQGDPGQNGGADRAARGKQGAGGHQDGAGGDRGSKRPGRSAQGRTMPRSGTSSSTRKTRSATCAWLAFTETTAADLKNDLLAAQEGRRSRAWSWTCATTRAAC